jgi:hypothetical protein
METIYVQIPAYRDSELEPTLNDLISKAKYPDRIRVRVCWQHSDEESLPHEFFNNPNLEILDVPFKNSQGCNWARRLIQEKWNNEDYTLFLDSHHRLVEYWDDKLIKMYGELKNDGIKKPLITAYLPPYDPGTDPAGREEVPRKIFSLKREDGLLVYLTGHKIPMWESLKKPIKAQFASLHFLFTEGDFNKEILFDDDIYFFGDEVLIGLRAFTHGYDMFHPHYVMGWHLYNRCNTRITHWADNTDYPERNKNSYKKLRDIFLGIETRDLGQKRTVQEYEYYIYKKLVE